MENITIAQATPTEFSRLSAAEVGTPQEVVVQKELSSQTPPVQHVEPIANVAQENAPGSILTKAEQYDAAQKQVAEAPSDSSVETQEVSVSAPQMQAVFSDNTEGMKAQEVRDVSALLEAGGTVADALKKFPFASENPYAFRVLAKVARGEQKELLAATVAFTEYADRIMRRGGAQDDEAQRNMVALFLRAKGVRNASPSNIEQYMQTGKLFEGRSVQEAYSWIYERYLPEKDKVRELSRWGKMNDFQQARYLASIGREGQSAKDFAKELLPQEFSNPAVLELGKEARDVALSIGVMQRDGVGDLQRNVELLKKFSPQEQLSMLRVISDMNPQNKDAFWVGEFFDRVSEQFGDRGTGLVSGLRALFNWWDNSDATAVKNKLGEELYERMKSPKVGVFTDADRAKVRELLGEDVDLGELRMSAIVSDANNDEIALRNALKDVTRGRYTERGAVSGFAMETGLMFADTAAFMAAGMSAGVVGIAAMSAGYALSEAGRSYEEMIARGVDANSAFWASGSVGVVSSASEYLGALIPLGKFAKGVFTHGVSKAGFQKTKSDFALSMLNSDALITLAASGAKTQKELFRMGVANAGKRFAVSTIGETGTEMVATSNEYLMKRIVGLNTQEDADAFKDEMMSNLKYMWAVGMLGSAHGAAAAKASAKWHNSNAPVTEIGEAWKLSTLSQTELQTEAMLRASDIVGYATGDKQKKVIDTFAGVFQTWSDMAPKDKQAWLEQQGAHNDLATVSAFDKLATIYGRLDQAFYEHAQKEAAKGNEILTHNGKEFITKEAQAARDPGKDLEDSKDFEDVNATDSVENPDKALDGAPQPENIPLSNAKEAVERVKILNMVHDEAPQFSLSAELAYAITGTELPGLDKDVGQAVKTVIERAESAREIENVLNAYASGALEITRNADAHAAVGNAEAPSKMELFVQKANAYGFLNYDPAESVEADVVEASGVQVEQERVVVPEKASDLKNGLWEARSPNTLKVVRGRWRVLDASQIKKGEGELQPRDRKRNANSDQQVFNIARNLVPEMLGEDSYADRGSPIVNQDGMLVAGNGRFAAINAAYGHVNGTAGVNASVAENYRKFVEQKAFELGVEIPEGIKDPVLVRELDEVSSQMSAVDLAKDTNISMTADYNEYEEANTDADAVEKLFPLMNFGKNGSPYVSENHTFMKAFFTLAGKASSAKYWDAKDKAWKEAAGKRVQHALLAWVLNDANSVRLLLENKEGINGLYSGLLRTAFAIAPLTNSKRYNIVPMLRETVKRYLDFRSMLQKKQVKSIDQYLGVQELDFGTGADVSAQAIATSLKGANLDTSNALLRLFAEHGNKNSSTIANVLYSYAMTAQRIESAIDNEQTGSEMEMFSGESKEAPNMTKLVLASIDAADGDFATRDATWGDLYLSETNAKGSRSILKADLARQRVDTSSTFAQQMIGEKLSKADNELIATAIGQFMPGVEVTISNEAPAWVKAGMLAYYNTKKIPQEAEISGGAIPPGDATRGTSSLLTEADFSDQDLGVIKESGSFVKLQKVFHGSPHDFGKFSLDQVGTGSGNNSFGFGLYFSEVKEVAEAYADDRNAQRNLYTVDIPDNNGKNYLAWEANIGSRMRAKIAQDLYNYLLETNEDGSYSGVYAKELKAEIAVAFGFEIKGNTWIPNKNIDISGGDIYGNISAYVGGEKRASEFLARKGFVGISYPASETVGGRNYVVFIDSVIELKDHIRYAKNDDGEIHGAYNSKTGAVWVREDAHVTTLMHEFGWHATFDWAKQNAPELHSKMLEYAKASPKELLDYIAGTYGKNGEISIDVLLDEAGAWMFSHEQTQKVRNFLVKNNEIKTWWGKLKELFVHAWRKMLKALGADNVYLKKLYKMSPGQAMNVLADAMFAGKRLKAKAPQGEQAQDTVLYQKALVEAAGMENKNIEVVERVEKSLNSPKIELLDEAQKKMDREAMAKRNSRVNYRDPDNLKILRAVPLISASVALYQNTEVTEALVRRSIPNDRQGEPELVNDVLQRAKKLVAIVRKNRENFASMKDAVEEVVETTKHLIAVKTKARLFDSLSIGSPQAFVATQQLATRDDNDERDKRTKADAMTQEELNSAGIDIAEEISKLGLKTDFTETKAREEFDAALAQERRQEKEERAAIAGAGTAVENEDGDNATPTPLERVAGAQELADSVRNYAGNGKMLVLRVLEASAKKSLGEHAPKVFTGKTSYNKSFLNEVEALRVSEQAKLVKTFRKTLVSVLENAMGATVAKSRRARAAKLLGAMEQQRNMRKLLVSAMSLVEEMSKVASTLSREELQKSLRAALVPFARMKERAHDVNRKMAGATEKFVNMIYKAFRDYGSLADARFREQEIAPQVQSLTMRSDDLNEQEQAKLRELALEQAALQLVGGWRTRSVVDLTEMLAKVEGLIESGKKLQEEAAEGKRESERARYSGITAGAGAGKKIVGKQPKKTIKSALTEGFSLRQRFEEVVKYAKGETRKLAYKNISELERALSKSYFLKESADTQMREWFRKTGEEIFGKGQLGSEMFRIKMLKEELAKFSADGKTPMSLDNVLHVYLMARQKQYQRPLEDPSAFDAAEVALIKRTVEQIPAMEEVLGEKLIALSDAMCGYLETLQPELRKAFRYVTGYDFFVDEEKYFPIKRNHENNMLGNPSAVLTSLPLAFSARVLTSKDIKRDGSAVGAFFADANKVGHFVAFHREHLLFQQMFADEDFVTAVKSHAGSVEFEALKQHVCDTLMPESVRDREENGLASFLSSAASTAALGFNVLVGMRQVTSLPAFMFRTSAADFSKAMITSPTKEAFKWYGKIVKSAQWQRRFGRGAMQYWDSVYQGKGASTRGWQKAMIYYMITNNLGDALPILLYGQWVGRREYAARLAEGMSEADAEAYAMNELWQEAEASQQTSRAMNMGNWMRSGSAYSRLLGQFTSSPSQFFAFEVRALSDLAADPTDMNRIVKAVKTVFINHILLAGSYLGATMVWNAIFTGDDDDEFELSENMVNIIAPLVFGPASGLFFYGQTIMAEANQMVGAEYRPYSIPTVSFIGKTFRVVKTTGAVALGDADAEDLWESVDKTVSSLIPSYRHIKQFLESHSK